jgi:hypothetical protein
VTLGEIISPNHIQLIENCSPVAGCRGLFSREWCQALLEEIDHMQSREVRETEIVDLVTRMRPNSMNNYGMPRLDLHTAFVHCCRRLVRGAPEHRGHEEVHGRRAAQRAAAAGNVRL